MCIHGEPLARSAGHFSSSPIYPPIVFLTHLLFGLGSAIDQLSQTHPLLPLLTTHKYTITAQPTYPVFRLIISCWFHDNNQWASSLQLSDTHLSSHLFFIKTLQTILRVWGLLLVEEQISWAENRLGPMLYCGSHVCWTIPVISWIYSIPW